MTAPYISSIARNKAARLGYSIEVKTTRRVRGWPVASEKPVQLWKGGKHIASFVNGIAVLKYLIRQEQAA